MTIPTAEDLLWKGHVRKIVEGLLAGKVVPFLGPDINLCDRPKTAEGKVAKWSDESDFPPSNQELAAFLDAISGGMGPAYHHEISCPFAESQVLEQLPDTCPLRRGGEGLQLPVPNVSQYVVNTGEKAKTTMNEALYGLFEKPYTPNTLHNFLASLPALLRSRTPTPTYPLMVTACFDSTLERAFQEAGEEVDVVSFIGDAQLGHFVHRAPNGTQRHITKANEDSELDLKSRPVILKLYGGYESQSFLITEDDYIDYLSLRDMTQLIPTSLLTILRANDTSILFLGYGLGLWNQRVILRRLWQEKLEVSGKPWWTVQTRPDQLDLRVWERYSVQVAHRPKLTLESYVTDLEARLQAMPKQAALAGEGMQGGNGRDLVFFSYSHEDKKSLDLIKKYLGSAIRSERLRVWDDSQIEVGAIWRDEIKKALAAARVAVLLVSPAFLNSEFIANDELPPLLMAEKNKGLIICPVFLKHCNLDTSGLKDYQAANDPKKPLSSISSQKRDEEISKIGDKIIEVFTRK
jgi:hypothetical protein